MLKKQFLFIAVFCVLSVLSAKESSVRTAWLREFNRAENKEQVIRKGLNSNDEELRAHAVYRLFMLKKEASLPELIKRIRTAGPAEGMNLVICARMIGDPVKKAAFLSKIAAETRHPEVAKEANRQNFPFFRKNIRLSERKDWDFEIVKTASIPLDKADWKFIFDFTNCGHLLGYQNANFSDKNWKNRKTGYWKGNRTAWYRIRFKAPEKPDCNAAELHFAGVEEAAWVWLNGTYIGCRDQGPTAWNKPFWLDVSAEIKWGQENILSVRVVNTGDEGGIYKPIALDILK